MWEISSYEKKIGAIVGLFTKMKRRLKMIELIS